MWFFLFYFIFRNTEYMKKRKSPYPSWLNKHRRPSTEIRKFKDKYYMYEVSSYYDKERKKGRKKTGKYLGCITEAEGFVAVKSMKVLRSYGGVNIKNLSTKEYGLSAFIQSYCKDIIDALKAYFPQQWEWMLVALYCRVLHTSPIKNMHYYYRKSFLSEQFDITVGANGISQLIRDLGSDRKPLTDFMKHLSGDEKFILMDATSIVSYSTNLTKVCTGLSKNKNYEPLFNLLYFYSPHSYLPSYYRLFNGNIKDVKMLSTALKESRYKDAIIIADKGFFSEENLVALEKENLHYIVPLRRNSTLIRYSRYKNLTKSSCHFLFENRVVYYDSYKLSKVRTIYLFIDEQMMVQEKKDFISRMQKNLETYTEEEFTKQLPQFGTFSVVANKESTAEAIFLNYKSRVGVEVLFDGVKNTLGNDCTYMQNDEALEGWMFVNHLALLVHHKIYALLKEKKLIKKYSIRDFVEYLSDMKKVKINDQWVIEPIIAEQQKLLKDTGVSIP
jgi:transposase